jgi:hypothetical protein
MGGIMRPGSIIADELPIMRWDPSERRLYDDELRDLEVSIHENSQISVSCLEMTLDRDPSSFDIGIIVGRALLGLTGRQL